MFDIGIRKVENKFFNPLEHTATIAEEKKENKRRTSTTIITSALALLTASSLMPMVFVTNAFAIAAHPNAFAVGGNPGAFTMGDNPSTCMNLYDSVITSMKITQGHRTIDPIAHPNAHFNSKVGVGYTVTFTLHSASKSNSGNTNVGSVWYGNTAYGFANGDCVNGVHANSDVTITLEHVYMGQATHGTKQSVDWYSWSNDTVLQGPTYTVHWR